MRTEHLDNKINELETLRSRGELTYMGGEMLSEFNEIKRALTIPVVVGQSEQLKDFREWWNKDNEGVCTTITHKDIDRYLESL